jgi:uncharacterized membrane protein
MGVAQAEALGPVLAGVAVGGAVALSGSVEMGAVVGWDTTAALYIGWLALFVLRRDSLQTARRATTTDPDRLATDALLLGAAVVSLVAVGVLLTSARAAGELTRGALGLASVVVSWAVVHSVYTLRYAAMYYGEPAGGIDFGGGEPPSYRDFAYLAFTVGMTFQVSHTALRTAAFRRTVLRHALLSYLFGTGILAVTINLVAGLRRM